jgi:hypothetical protein
LAFSNIVGTYKAHGIGQSGPYTSTVVIQKQGEIYSATWNYPDGSYETGTGVRKDGVLSFIFKEGSEDLYGVQQYKIEDQTLNGPWVFYSGTFKGFEKLKKVEKE